MCTTHHAVSSVPARVAVAVTHLQLTVDPGVARPARARVAALPGVHARGSVHTRLVVGAEVQI